MPPAPAKVAANFLLCARGPLYHGRTGVSRAATGDHPTGELPKNRVACSILWTLALADLFASPISPPSAVVAGKSHPLNGGAASSIRFQPMS